MENQCLNAEGADSSQSSQTSVECGINARCAGYATIPRTPLLEEKRIQEAGRRVIAAAAASMTHALPICELCEASVNSAFCLYLPILMEQSNNIIHPEGPHPIPEEKGYIIMTVAIQHLLVHGFPRTGNPTFRETQHPKDIDMSPFLRRSWVEINLRSIVGNCRLCHREAEVMAVVKANAYGHGDVPVAQTLQRELQVRNFAVSNLEEAVRLREHGIHGQILILGHTPVDAFPELLEYDITQAILDEDYARRAARTGLRVKAHFAIDTGMNRIGLDADSPEACAACIRSHLADFQITGFFTHLCVADSPQSAEANRFTDGQIAKFREVCRLLEDLHLPYPHCLNSAATLWHPCPESKLERLGIVLYGLKPDYENTLPQGVTPALQWKTVVSMVKEVRPGETVGYGRTYAPQSPRRIATLPVGYADGYSRLLSNRGKVLLHGREAPVVGRVCMDQITIDVTEIPETVPEDEVTLLGKCGALQYTADDMAQTIGTIGYEVVCNISNRITRVYP